MPNQPHILVIDDEPQILRALRTVLTAQHFLVTLANRGEEGLALAAANPPDLIILDMNLPDMDGLQVCEQLREWTQLPIIVLSVRDSERDKVQALNKGADDYLAKPFYIDELVARIRVALRHAAQAQVGANPKVTIGDLVIDLAAHTITKSGQDVKLTATEYKLLAYLVSHSGRVLTHQSILTHVWGIEYMDNVEYLRVYISQLRKKLENDPQQPHWLISEPGVGYRFSLNE